jgi:hypothetical protein
VRDQLPDGGAGTGRPEPGRTIVEAFEYLQVSEFRAVGVDGRIEVQAALLRQLQRCRGGHHLGHRGDPQHGVRGDRIAGIRGALSGRALIEHAVSAGCQGYHARHITSCHRRLQNLVDFTCHSPTPKPCGRNDARPDFRCHQPV